jgi:uncharacterized protein (TIGR02246 family)
LLVHQAQVSIKVVILRGVDDPEMDDSRSERPRSRRIPIAQRRESVGDEQQILQLFQDGDRALIAGDVAELSHIFADDYVQYDESGNVSTKSDVIANLTSGKIRFISMISTGRRIRMLRDDVAVVHGSEDDVIEQAGRRYPARYFYMDVVVKRNGGWQIVASQLARPPEAD